jgi:putative tricarboxylic transport membrane protein
MTATYFRRRGLRWAAVALGLAALVGCQGGGGSAESFPSEQVDFIVGFSPGGGSDVFARTLAQATEETLPERIVVENREGGGGTTANAFVRGAKPDGYTILSGNAGSTILTPTISNSPELMWDQFAPIARIHAEEEFLFLRPDSRWKTIDEVVNFARENAGAVRVGGSAVGGIDSFVSIQLERAAGVDFTYVPFDGGGPALQSFLGGNVDLLIGNLSDAAASVEAGQVIPVAVASEKRGALPEVPTLAERGWNIVLQQWRGVLAPKDTPPDRIQILADAFEAAMAKPKWVEYRDSTMSVDMFLGPQEFTTFLEEQEAEFVPLIDELGLVEK